MTGGHAFKVRVGAIVLDAENRLLLARQNGRDFWVLPGGTLEPEDTLETCAIRELKEEANLNIAVTGLFTLADFFAPNGQHVVDAVFHARLLGGTLARETTQNIDDIGFFSLDEVHAMDVKPEAVMTHIRAAWQDNRWQPVGYIGDYR